MEKKNRVYKVLAKVLYNVKSNIERQLEFPCSIKLVYFHLTKIQSDIQHQRSDKSLKIKFKALKELEKGTPHKDVAWIAKICQE